MSEDQKQHKTSYLGNISAEPMPEELEKRRGVVKINDNTKLQIKIGDKQSILPIRDNMLVGRQVENDPTPYGVDLGPFGGYQSGVSRKHALITHQDEGLFIEDLGSTNGTRINGFQLTVKRKYRLRDGDEIEFARLRTQIRFIDGGTTEETSKTEEAVEVAETTEGAEEPQATTAEDAPKDEKTGDEAPKAD